MMRVRLWQAVISGASVGLLAGIALQIAREIRHQRTFDGMIDFLKPEAIPVAVSLLFASLGGLVWVAWSRQQH